VGLGEASGILGVSAGTLRRWADAGRIPAFTTPGGHRRFSRRSLLAMVPARRAERPSLLRLGASAERIAGAYRRRPRRHPVAQDLPWVSELTDADRSAFRDQGRHLIELLVAHLDATGAAIAANATGAPGSAARAGRNAAADLLDEAMRVAAEHGRRMAALGISLTEGVQSFLQFRAPFMRELSSIARRRGLDTREATALLASAGDVLDRLLMATIEGYTGAGARRDARGADTTAHGGGLREGAQSGADPMRP
jgi:excisionase family DNA binding protein